MQEVVESTNFQKTLFSLNSLAPTDGRYHEKTAELQEHFSEAALIRTRIEIEIVYLLMLSEYKLLPRMLSIQEQQFLSTLHLSLSDNDLLRVKEIERVTRHDVQAAIVGLKEFLPDSLNDVKEFIHLALTSEDVNNIAYRLMTMRALHSVCIPTLDILLGTMVDMAEGTKELVMMARTHGQAAVPTTLGKEIIDFAIRLHNQIQKLKVFPLTGKMNGAVGNYNAHVFAFPNVNWIGFTEAFIRKFGLVPEFMTTQINPYDDLAELFDTLGRVNRIIIDFDQDFWRYISDGWLGQKVIGQEVGSSTMPQKVNPIDFENGEGNLGLANALLKFFSEKLMISRLQRDLSDSTVIRNVGLAFGYSLLAYKSTLSGLGRVVPHKENITKALLKEWSPAEGAQVLLRRYEIPNAYDLLKNLTRGKGQITQKKWENWVNKLPDTVSVEVKAQLLALTPQAYIGMAVQLTETTIQKIRKER